MLVEVVADLSDWLNSKELSPVEEKRITVVKRKLIDFHRNLVKEEQNRERRTVHLKRLDKILEPEQVEKDASTSQRNFGLKSQLKGSSYYKDIPTIYGPQPLHGGGQ
jgi:hypothetical protein